MYNKHLSDSKIAAIIRCFCEDVTATSTAAIVGTSRNTVNAYFHEFRQLIFHETLKESGLETGEFELDESYFGAKRIRGKSRR
jgi:transposase